MERESVELSEVIFKSLTVTRVFKRYFVTTLNI